MGNTRGDISMMNRSTGNEATVIRDIGHLYHPLHLVRFGDAHVVLFPAKRYLLNKTETSYL
jgi:hypothetical protein